MLMDRTKEWTWISSAFSLDSSYETFQDGSITRDKLGVIDIISNEGSDAYDDGWENKYSSRSQERKIRKTSQNMYDTVSNVDIDRRIKAYDSATSKPMDLSAR